MKGEETEERTDVMPEPARGEPVEKGKRSWINVLAMVLVAVLLMMIIAGLSVPMVLRSAKATERTMAINNAKQIGLALLEFDQEFGSFPDAETAEVVKSSTGTNLDLWGTSSNALFRQLIAYSQADGGASRISEQIFLAPKHPECALKPDGNLSPGKALEAGELGWSYLMLGEGSAQNTSGNPGRAVLAAPMKIGTEQFWPKPFKDKAVILRLDNSVEAPLIREDGKVTVGNGKTLFDNGPETVWGDERVQVRHPEPGR